jgi:thioesterase domain-containing protein
VTTAELLAVLRERDVRLRVEDGRLKADAPAGVLDDLRPVISQRRDELLRVLENAATSRSAPRSLVPLKAGGDAAPLFARPGHNGDVFCYVPLAARLAAERPLYGIEPMGLDGGAVGATVEEMAAYEADQIRALQPSGPYYVAGYCAGGTIAFETAVQLKRAGEEVARVLLFGAPFPHAYRAGKVVSGWRSLNHRGRRHMNAITAGSVSDGIGYVRERAGVRMRDARRDGAEFAHRRRLEDATVEAVKRYDPSFYDGRIDIFLPSEAWRRSGDRPDDWKEVAAAAVEHIGPDGADGDDMLREPHVNDVAALLNVALHEQGEPHAAD